MTLKLNLKKHEKHGICDTFAKTLPKNKNEEHWKTKTPTHRVVDENLAKYRVFLISTKKNLPKINDTPHVAADARATFLLLFVVVVVVIRRSTSSFRD